MMNFRELREESGYQTKYDLAKALGVPITAVNRWEVGITTPKGDDLYNLVKVLGVPTKRVAHICADTVREHYGNKKL